MEYEKVAIVQDGDGHEYIIPFELLPEFEFANDCADDETINRDFWKYNIGGALSLVELYVKGDYFEKNTMSDVQW